jgi:O-antigen/teichoic acid export membrane protein
VARQSIKNPFLKRVIILCGGTAVVQIIAALASPLITRLYTPADFGLLAIFLSIIALLTIVASLKYEMAIPIPAKEEEAATLVQLSFVVLSIMTAAVIVSILIFGGPLLRVVNAEAILPYVWLLPVTFFGAGLYQLLNYWAIRTKRFKAIALTNVAQTGGQTVVQVALGFFHMGHFGLLVGAALGRMAGSLRLLGLLWQDQRSLFGDWTLQKLKLAAHLHRRFAVAGAPAAVLHIAGFQLPPLLLSAVYSAQVTGWFALQDRLLMIPLSLLAQSVAQVFYGEAARLANEDPVQLKALFIKTFKNLLVIGIVPIGIVALAGPWIFSFVFGPDWREAGWYAQVLSVTTLIRFAVGPVFYSLTILGKQSWQLLADALGVVVMLAGFWVCSAYSLSPTAAIIFYGISILITYLLLLILSFIAVRNHASNSSAAASLSAELKVASPA